LFHNWKLGWEKNEPTGRDGRSFMSLFSKITQLTREKNGQEKTTGQESKR
jgi:hypothetical protein